MQRVFKNIQCKAALKDQSSHEKIYQQLCNLNCDNLLKRIYYARGVRSTADIDYGLANLPSFNYLSNIDAVCQKLFHCLQKKSKLTIVGDYDVDGATATSLSYHFFNQLGYHCDFFIPDRFEYGYGLSERIVSELHQQGVEVILTVDNGINSLAGVEKANSLGITVIITDHHIAGEYLPDTKWIINPSLPYVSDKLSTTDQSHLRSLKSLAGVGVIFYVLMAFRSFLRDKDWFVKSNIKEPNLAHYLDLVALGTVADVVPLTYPNRIFVSQGLRRIRSQTTNKGLLALFKISNKDITRANTDDLGYSIAPRLNAAGRLKDMSLGVKCLLTDDDNDAMQLAMQLEKINQQRKEIQQQMQAQALNIIDTVFESLQKHSDANDGLDHHSLIVYQNSWHQGVTGLIASHLKEAYYCPALAFAPEEQLCKQSQNDVEQAILKGSARSIDGIHIKDVLNIVDARFPNILLSYGGHAMAAGMSIYKKDLQDFKNAFKQALLIYRQNNHFQQDNIESAQRLHQLPDDNINSPVLWTDGELSESELDIYYANMLANEGPWGQSFETPLFENKFIVLEQKLLTGKHLKLKLKYYANKNDSDVKVDAIYFNFTDKYEEMSISNGALLHVAYHLDVNSFRGNESLQLNVQEIKMQ